MPEGYREVYAGWENDPVGFWMAAAREIDWVVSPGIGFDPESGAYGRWFPDAMCNTCHNAIDRHVAAGRGGQTAIIYDSPLAQARRRISYAEMLAAVQATAVAIQDLGIGRGDRVIIYMPMVPEAVFAMLACARLGAVHSVVFGGFAARELAARIDDAEAKLVLSVSCGFEPGRIVAYKPLLDEALALCRAVPDACLILQRPQSPCAMVAGRDHDWATAIDRAEHSIQAGVRWAAFPSAPPTRFISSTPRARPGGRRAWCATMAGTWWRCCGRCGRCMACARATCSGRRRISAGWSVTA